MLRVPLRLPPALPGVPPDSGPQNFTRRLSRHAGLVQWWTLQQDALHTDAAGDSWFPPRKGGAAARLCPAEGSEAGAVASTAFAALGPRNWPCNPGQTEGGPHVEARFAMEKHGVWTVVAITHTTAAGSDPWGLHLDADALPLVQVVNATTRGNGSLRLYDPDPGLRQDVDLGPAVALKRTTAAVAVIDLDRGDFKLAPDLTSPPVSGHAPRLAEQARAAEGVPQARLVMGRAMAEQPLGGWFMDYLLIRGDLYDQPELRADLSAYFDRVWKGLAP